MAPFKMQERDVDLFILEELYSDSGFADWFAAQIGIAGAAFLSAEHSISAKVNAKWGETDVLAFFLRDQTRIAVLIEDKISAAFADTQCERYHERANEILSKGMATEYKTVLIAPQTYLAGVPKNEVWNSRLAIDDIALWFEQKGGSHAIWRAQAIRNCIKNAQKIYSATNEECRAFSEDFSNYLKKSAPEFTHDVTGDKWGLSVKFAGRPKNILIHWKVNQSLVDLTLTGRYRGKLALIPNQLGTIDRSTADSDILSIPVGSASWGEPLTAQSDVVSEVVAACQRLRSLALEIAAMP